MQDGGHHREREIKKTFISINVVKLAEEWTSKLGEGAAAHHRDVSCAELVKKGKEVKLSFQLDDMNVAASAPIFNRLSNR